MKCWEGRGKTPVSAWKVPPCIRMLQSVPCSQQLVPDMRLQMCLHTAHCGRQLCANPESVTMCRHLWHLSTHYLRTTLKTSWFLTSGFISSPCSQYFNFKISSYVHHVTRANSYFNFTIDRISASVVSLCWPLISSFCARIFLHCDLTSLISEY